MKAIVLMLVIALAGCAGASRNDSAGSADAEYKALGVKLSEALNGPELAPLKGKVYLGLDVRQTPLDLLALEARPTEEEKRAIAAWHAIRYGEFWTEWDSLNVRYMPWVRPFWDLNRGANSTLTAQLYTGEITYGEFNRKRMQLSVDTMNAINRRGEELRQSQAQADYVNQVSSLQAASVALQGYSTMLQGQQLLNAQMQPVRIAPFTCNRYGFTTQCF